MTPNRLMPLVYDELRTLARSYLRGAAPDYALQPTLLVHEAYLKLVQQGCRRIGRAGLTLPGCRRPGHASDSGGLCPKSKNGKSGGADVFGWIWVTTSPFRWLVRTVSWPWTTPLIKAGRQGPAKGGNCGTTLFWGAMNVEEVAEISLNCSKRKVEQDWTYIRAWLRRELNQDHAGDPHLTRAHAGNLSARTGSPRV